MRLTNKWTYIVIGGGLVCLVLGYGIYHWQPITAKQNTTTTDRQRYAALYQAAWRQDDGTAPTLITATLLVPPTIQLLGQDTGRSVTEEQQWQILKNLKSTQVAFIITVDSVVSAIPDDVFLHGLALTIDHGPKATFSSWSPIIAPSRITNPTNSTSSQLGVAIFDLDQPLDWQTVQALEVHLTGITGERERTFSWITPKMLLQVQ